MPTEKLWADLKVLLLIDEIVLALGYTSSLRNGQWWLGRTMSQAADRRGL